MTFKKKKKLNLDSHLALFLPPIKKEL